MTTYTSRKTPQDPIYVRSKKILDRLDVSRYAFAKRVGVTRQLWSMYDAVRHAPEWMTVKKTLAAYPDVSPGRLLFIEGKMVLSDNK